MKIATNFYFWGACSWLLALTLYRLAWSELNYPLAPALRTYFFTTLFALTVMTVIHSVRTSREPLATPVSSPSPREREARRKRYGMATGALVLGFAADFGYQRTVPLLAGEYRGYDVSRVDQTQTGIPVLHVLLISGAILLAVLLADCAAVEREKRYVILFAVVLLLLLLNNSRGYMTFCLLGASLVALSRGRRLLPRRPLAILGGGYIGLLAIGGFGNIRSGSAWNDASLITRLGRINASWPDLLHENLRWTYTYLTTPLANLNLNYLHRQPRDDMSVVIASLLPESLPLPSTSVPGVMYAVEPLNASTGYIATYLAAGLFGMMTLFLGQIVLLQAGSEVARRLPDTLVVYCACASIILVSFVFFNSFNTAATSALLPGALLVGFVRRRRTKTS